MANTSLILSASKKSKIANSFGAHGLDDFSELCDELDKVLEISQFTPEQLAGIIDFADKQRQAGFYEGVKAGRLHPNNSLRGYDSTTDTCDQPDYEEEEEEENDFGNSEEVDSGTFGEEEELFRIDFEKDGESINCPNDTWKDFDSAKNHALAEAKYIGGTIKYSIVKVNKNDMDEEVDSGVIVTKSYNSIVADLNGNLLSENKRFKVMEEAYNDSVNVAKQELLKHLDLPHLLVTVVDDTDKRVLMTGVVSRNDDNEFAVVTL